MKYWILLPLIFLFSLKSTAQELNASVQILAPKVQTSDRRIFKTLETSIREFLNNRKWTDANYDNEERIECQFLINIESMNNGTFSGSIQVFYSRPIFMSDYKSPVLLHQDGDFDFNYVEYDRLDFAENTFLDNLTSILAYYSYVIIGLDRDTYTLNGGTPYYALAQTVLGNAQNNNFTGWGSFDGTKNRFWLVDNLTSPAFDNFRSCLYMYHRQGLDLMHDQSKVRSAKNNIKNALVGLKKVNDQRRNSFILQIWFDAKTTEITQIFGGGDPIPISDLKDVLVELDPNNSSKYEEIGQG
jgi:hypothetical protein